ncbi:MAG: branched-chain amino acid dehydrogenase [Firmicutes bacterium HGW-Firmicutes-12]|nr:MAG: branched-chain amino acid dehydrogenase [Firmicutes bacterium HGW-Firmicutes-12]
MSKLTDINSIINRINNGAVLMIGGFLGVGTPENIIDALVAKGVKNLTIITNDTSFPGRGISKLVAAKQIKKLIVSHIGTNPETGRQMNAGEIEVELVPQGTLAERIRAGGSGLGGILTPTGVGTIVEEGKKILEIDGKKYLLELPLKADVAFLKAYMADEEGNLVYHASARNFNPIMAMAADYVVAEVEHFHTAGNIPPDEVMTTGILVNSVIFEDSKDAMKGGA